MYETFHENDRLLEWSCGCTVEPSVILGRYITHREKGNKAKLGVGSPDVDVT